MQPPAPELMVVLAVAELLAVFGSAIAAPVASKAATEAVSLTLPVVAGLSWTETVTVAVAPAAIGPRLQEIELTPGEPLQSP